MCIRDSIRRPQRPLVAPPHPELTPQQKQHISERSGENNSAQSQPPKRFGGSVAERVMIFERCPIVNDSSKEGRNDKRVNTMAAAALTPSINNSAPPWKNLQQEGMGKVQVIPFHHIDSFESMYYVLYPTLGQLIYVLSHYRLLL